MKKILILTSVSLVLCQCSKYAPLAAGSMMAHDAEATELFQEAQAKQADSSLRSARKKYEQIVEYHPIAEEAPLALLNIGDIWLQKEEPVDAFEAYDKLLKNYPSSSLYPTALGREEKLAFGAADGVIGYKLFGLFNTRVDSVQVCDMLEKISENAPYSDLAPKALLKQGQVRESVGADDLAIESYHKIIDKYATSTYAPQAQFSIGHIYLVHTQEGDRNSSKLNAAQEAYEDFLLRYPKHSLAGQVKKELNEVRYRLALKGLEIADYYLKSGSRESAISYYQIAAFNRYNAEVREKAKSKLYELGVTPKNPSPDKEMPVMPEQTKESDTANTGDAKPQATSGQ